ncbi:tRNA (guanine(9)-N(1))-methyltransferase [Kluyveromyces marxianus]|nr:tRNA (guanine(9)-N(1))-methyltransferase [Kluyveromyces marxianus]KAG0682628.1 tRNA (guanine(9)-N(1))-methyltransferase [Kluyveromyces marxianus]
MIYREEDIGKIVTSTSEDKDSDLVSRMSESDAKCKEDAATEVPVKEVDSNPIIRAPQFPPPPEGISKSQWKKICRKKRFEETKAEYALIRKEKKAKARQARREKLQEYLDKGEEIPEDLKRPPKVNLNQKDSGISIILDCAFDDLMNDREVVSLSTQITRAYSSNKRENHYANIKVTSFDKRLKKRFDNELSNCNYSNWKNFTFDSDSTLPTENVVYLTADTDEKLETLEPGTTYIVGGIVDKNRHKNLCLNKAKELNIPTRRLPIDEFISLAGRKVLTTSHMVQLMLRYFDNKDWKEAFESVLPPRKLGDKSGSSEE